MNQRATKALYAIKDKLTETASLIGDLIDAFDQEPGPEPEPDTGYRLITEGQTWSLAGKVTDWKDALLFPRMEFSGPIKEIILEMTIKAGPAIGGLRNLIYLTKDSDKWSGDVVLMVNRGGNGRMVVSHTLTGPEVKFAGPFKLAPGQQFNVAAIIRPGGVESSVSLSPETQDLRVLIPPAEVARSLTLQLGNAKSDGSDHPTNDGWELLYLRGTVG